MTDFFSTGRNSTVKPPPFAEEMPEVADLIRLKRARRDYNVDGSGSCIAVLDSGVRATHKAFTGRIKPGLDFQSGLSEENTSMIDPNGHGTHVCGIAAASRWQDRSVDQRDLSGVAPGAHLLPIKVLDDDGRTRLAVLEEAFSWLSANAAAQNISVVCMSITDEQNHRAIPGQFAGNSILENIEVLDSQNIPVVIAAGNMFYTHDSEQGMGFPAISPHVVSVGSVYDDDIGARTYWDQAACTRSQADQITPYSQRLSAPSGTSSGTTVFAPGGLVTSVGHRSDQDTRSDDGTSQAAPVVAGLIALMQDAYSSWYPEGHKSPTLMSVADIKSILRHTAKTVNDDDLGRDNVTNTGASFLRIDALDAVRVASRFGRASLS